MLDAIFTVNSCATVFYLFMLPFVGRSARLPRPLPPHGPGPATPCDDPFRDASCVANKQSTDGWWISEVHGEETSNGRRTPIDIAPTTPNYVEQLAMAELASPLRTAILSHQRIIQHHEWCIRERIRSNSPDSVNPNKTLLAGTETSVTCWDSESESTFGPLSCAKEVDLCERSMCIGHYTAIAAVSLRKTPFPYLWHFRVGTRYEIGPNRDKRFDKF